LFDIAPSEMLLVAVVAIVFIGPKDLPRVMRTVGQWVGRGRSMARHFRGAMDEMIREAELQEMEEKWKAENERIMREHATLIEGVAAPVTPPAALPAPEVEAPPVAEPPASPKPQV
jgi:sec-independent protein translocase protein TatB